MMLPTVETVAETTSFKLRTSVEFDAAHFLPNYEGKCQNLHGHRWIVDIEITTKDVNDNGMIIDFGDIKKYINDNYDHRILNKCPFTEDALATIENVSGADLTAIPFKWGTFDNPTAENIAARIVEDVKLLIPRSMRQSHDDFDESMFSVRVELFESPKSSVVVIK